MSRRHDDGAREPAALVIHPGALGDVLQAVPALRALRRLGRVAFCGQPRLGAIVAGTGLADQALSFDAFGLEGLFTDEPAPSALEERLRHYDAVVSWFGSSDAGYPKRLAALARRCVVAPPVPGVARQVQEPGGVAQAASPAGTVWEHLLATVRPIIGVPVADRSPLDVPPDWREEARRALMASNVALDQPFVVVHPGAGGRWKLVDAGVLAEVLGAPARGGRVQLVVHAGPADREATQALCARLCPTPPVLAEPSLPALAGVLSLAAAYLGGDSGVSHLAAAVGAPAVILFPPATYERWTPWSPAARPIEMGDGAAAAAAAALGEALAAALTHPRNHTAHSGREGAGAP